jgi:hypothetical protein
MCGVSLRMRGLVSFFYQTSGQMFFCLEYMTWDERKVNLMIGQLLDRDDFWSTPFRKITNKGVKKNIGKFPSAKMGRNIWYESVLESDLIELLEFDPDVIRYKEQPFRLRYFYEGQRRSYIPDIFAQRRNKLQAIEVKPQEKAATKMNKLRYQVISSIFEYHGIEFVVATETRIRVQPLLDNVKICWGYARTPVHPLHETYIRDHLASRQVAPINELVTALAGNGVTLQIIYSLIYRGVLATNLHLPVSPTSIVTLTSERSNVSR